jgi:predicted metal-dependent peptidase
MKNLNLNIRRFWRKLMRKSKPGQVLFAIDNSGSMVGQIPITAVKKIVDNLYVEGKTIQIVLFSNGLDSSYTYAGEINLDNVGGGGTEVDYVMKLLNVGDYDECFCVTDGYLQVIVQPTKKVTWLLCGDNPENFDNPITRELKQYGDIEVLTF